MADRTDHSVRLFPNVSDLSGLETFLRQQLRDRLSAVKKLPSVAKRRKFILMCDFFIDFDDENALLELVTLHRMGVIELMLVVANAYPSDDRATGARGMLNVLGGDLWKVQVARGTNANGHRRPIGRYEFLGVEDYTTNVDQNTIGNMERLVTQVLGECAARDEKVTIVANSALTDLARLFQFHGDLMARAVEEIVFMGDPLRDLGKPESTGNVILDANGHFRPGTAQNCKTDDTAAADVMQWVQSHLNPDGTPVIKLIMVTREIVYGVKVPYVFYRQMLWSENPIGERLVRAQDAGLVELFRKTLNPAAHGLPPDRDWRWFRDEFCGKNPDIHPAMELIPGDHVRSIMLYDAVNSLFAVPEFRPRFAMPVAVINGHEVYGTKVGKRLQHGITDVASLKQVMAQLILESLRPMITTIHGNVGIKLAA